MKGLKTYRLLLALSLVIMLPCASVSQNFDTICLPKADAIKLLTKAEEGKLLAEKVTLLNEQILLLGDRIREKEQQIAALEQIGSANESIIATYKNEIEAMNGQRKVLDMQATDLKKEVKRYKRKLFWRTAGGITLFAGAAYLYITK